MYSVVIENTFKKKLKKLDKSVEKKIVQWIDLYVESDVDPKSHGKALKGNYRGLWRYRVGKYRIVVIINDIKKTVKVVEVYYRREAYRELNGLIRGITTEELKVVVGGMQEDEFTLEETIYDLELVRQYEKDKKAGKITSRPIEELFQEYGL
jgi:mRNA interferase RelE/StbE